MSYTYKSKNGKDFFVPGIGQSKDGVIVSPRPLRSPNLTLVNSEAAPQSPVQAVTPTAQAAAVIGVAPQATVEQPAVPVQPINQEQNK